MTTTRRALGALAAGAGLAALVPGRQASASSRHRPGRLIARDDFRHGLSQWATELQDGGTVTAARGVLDIDVPSGATVWFRRALRGPYVIGYTATAISAGGANDRVSDLNNFWNATDARSPDDLFATPRGGALAEYDHLRTYYAGYGANGNTTTRLRRYVGEAGVRPLILDYTEPLLTANRPNRVRIVSDGSTVQWWNNGRLVFDHDDPEPYTRGHFAFRTVWSHFAITDFRVGELRQRP
ncbi:DUF6250 domain-containing protein [Streptomyces sp. Qhu-G9]|uniref:DUF6250 domain-containing protein n=1 Tax=Streptomyces sp. Qhu-G9 TaxID=3452799 RepID=UPI0022ABE4ED|nr:DUF6250 domain-containing protein [Streptomyces aurantiacus]WAU83810.1 DUF6250 domain-containing protein [Streptomyces aurantiacus]